MYRRVLIGFDGSPASRGAVRAGAEIATALNGDATVLIVAPAGHGETEEDRQAAYEQAASSLRALARAELETLPRGSTEVSIQVVSGDDPAELLARFAREHAFDLLVVGRHGHDHAIHAGLGRQARRLAESAPLPLLLVG